MFAIIIQKVKFKKECGKVYGKRYLWPTAAERKLRTVYQAGLPAYLYGVTGVGKTSLIRHFLEKKEYIYVSALNTTPDDLESEKITAPVIVLDDLYAISDIRLKDAYYQKIQEWMERNDLWLVLMNKIAGQLGLAEVTVKYHCRETYRKLGVNGKAAAVNEARKRKLI